MTTDTTDDDDMFALEEDEAEAVPSHPKRTWTIVIVDDGRRGDGGHQQR